MWSRRMHLKCFRLCKVFVIEKLLLCLENEIKTGEFCLLQIISVERRT
jgi:hypothetical protein